LNLHGKKVSAKNLLEYFCTRKNVKFYRSFENPQATVSKLSKRFPCEENTIIRRAKRKIHRSKIKEVNSAQTTQSEK
jgi:hypothetical protein